MLLSVAENSVTISQMFLPCPLFILFLWDSNYTDITFSNNILHLSYFSFPYLSVLKSKPVLLSFIYSHPGSGRSPRERKVYLFQFSCLENSMYRGGWRATVHGHDWMTNTLSYSLMLTTSLWVLSLDSKCLLVGTYL